jgi:hypothetical protein
VIYRLGRVTISMQLIMNTAMLTYMAETAWWWAQRFFHNVLRFQQCAQKLPAQCARIS